MKHKEFDSPQSATRFILTARTDKSGYNSGAQVEEDLLREYWFFTKRQYDTD